MSVFVAPADPRLQYMGRIDFDQPQAPVFVYPCTNVTIRFRGTSVRARVTNLHSYYENSMGVILDGAEKKVVLTDDPEVQELVLGENLPEGNHTLMFYKRQDSCHHVVFHGFLLEGELLDPLALQKRRMEFFGDSVTAGEVCEAVDYCGQPDPKHNGEYSNSYYSYAWITARRLNARIHDTAQGGIALLEGTGYFCAPQLLGMEYMYDKIQYNPGIQPTKQWDFSRYMPHVVVIAIGQNDNHPVDIMEEDIVSPKAMEWRSRYAAFVKRIRSLYPRATIILSTTILGHGKNWDLAIEAVQKELNDPKIHHFLYSNNGCGTQGHIRIPEAEKMAEELSAYIAALGEEIWEETE